MKKIFSILFTILSFSVVAQQQLTLEKCRSMALEHNRQSTISEKTVEKAQYTAKAFQSNFFPKISLTGNYLFNNKKTTLNIEGGFLPTFVPDPATGNLVPNILTTIGDQVIFNEYAYMPDIPFEFQIGSVWMAGASLEQPIYMGGKIVAAQKMAKIGAEMSEQNKELIRLEVIEQTDEAYWTYVKTGELLSLAKKYKEVISELLRNMEDAVDEGMKPYNDLLKVQVKVNEANLSLRRAENGINLARMNLCHVIGLPLDTDLIVSDSLSNEQTVIEHSFSIDSRPEYALLSNQINLKFQQIRLTRSEFLPNVGLMASWTYMDGLKLNDDKLLSGGSLTALMSVNIPLFHWGEGINKIRAAKIEQQIAELQRTDMEELMTLEVSRARNLLDESKIEVDMTETLLAQAKDNLESSKNLYEVGMETLVNYLEAQATWQKAWAEMITAKATLKMNTTRYLKAIGKL